jgi:hypothetical protein
MAIAKEALVDEARKWMRLSEEMQQINKDVVGLELFESAFFAGNPIAGREAKLNYDAILDQIADLTKQATAEFEQISVTLRQLKDNYETVDGNAALDLNQIYGR